MAILHPQSLPGEIQGLLLLHRPEDLTPQRKHRKMLKDGTSEENGLLAQKPSLSRVRDVRVKEEQRETTPFARRTPSDYGDFSESDSLSLEPLHPLEMSPDRTPGGYLAPLLLGTTIEVP
ncbi:hypothetical protein EI94DRAFT_1837463 [Lactarius quietus]|nr:hypothetical protein EI94DRAFT_1837463 [Lactarius quietus]